MPFVSIVIVHWRGQTRLQRCLEALRRDADATAVETTGIELIVVANGSEAEADIDLDAIAAVWPDRITVRIPENRGFAVGANLGIARAQGRWVCTLNDDTEVEPGFMSALLASARAADPRCGMLQPCMVQAQDVGRIDSTGVVIGPGASIEDRDRGRPRAEGRVAREVFCASAGAGWYRREMLEDVARGGRVFDSGYYMYFEDVDLGWRGRLAGWHALYVPEAVVRHGRHESAEAKASGFVRRQCMRNRLRVVLANGSVRFVISALPRLARDVGGLILDSGLLGVRDALQAVFAGLAARRAVLAEARFARPSVERTWFKGAS